MLSGPKSLPDLVKAPGNKSTALPALQKTNDVAAAAVVDGVSRGSRVRSNSRPTIGNLQHEQQSIVVATGRPTSASSLARPPSAARGGRPGTASRIAAPASSFDPLEQGGGGATSSTAPAPKGERPPSAPHGRRPSTPASAPTQSFAQGPPTRQQRPPSAPRGGRPDTASRLAAAGLSGVPGANATSPSGGPTRERPPSAPRGGRPSTASRNAPITVSSAFVQAGGIVPNVTPPMPTREKRLSTSSTNSDLNPQTPSSPAGANSKSPNSKSKQKLDAAIAMSTSCDDAAESAPRSKAARQRTLGNPLTGISAFHLSESLPEKMKAKGFERTALIYDIEPTVIRPLSAKVICPRDKKMGAAYVDAFEAPDDVGISKFMLSYSWGYSVGDIADTIVHHCRVNDLSLKRTYFWLCCFCINQHRVIEKQEAGEIIPFEEFQSAFQDRVRRIGHILAMMAPWREPLYIKRVWCDFELYTASNGGAEVTISMPPREAEDFLQALLTGSGVDEMWKALGSLSVKRAGATVKQDRDRILQLIEEGPGYHQFDSEVAKYLQTWIVSISEHHFNRQLEAKTMAVRDLLAICHRVGDLLLRVGKPTRAIATFEEGARLLEEVTDNDVAQNNKARAILCENIGIAKRQLGDLQGAMAAYDQARELTGVSEQSNESRRAELQNRGNLKLHSGDLEGAVQNFNEALQIECNHRHSQISRGAIYASLGNAKAKSGALEEALEAYTNSDNLYEEAGAMETPARAELMSNIGNVRRMRNETKAAMEAYDHARRIFERTGTMESPSGASLNVNIAIIRGQSGDFAGALEDAEKATQICESVGLRDTTVHIQAQQIVEMAKASQKNSATTGP